MKVMKPEYLDELSKYLKENASGYTEYVVRYYTFYFFKNTFKFKEDHEIFTNLKKSKSIIIKQYKENPQNLIFFIICFKKTLLIINKLSFNLLKNLFDTNTNIPVYYLSNTKNSLEISNLFENQLFEWNNSFIDEIMNFNSYIVFKTHQNESINKLWKIILPCLTGYLIKEGYSKLNDKQNLILNNFNKNQTEIIKSVDNWDKKEFIILRLLGIGSSFFTQLIYHFEKGELFTIKEPRNVDQNKKREHLSVKETKKEDRTKNEVTALIDREIDNYLKINYPLLPKMYGISVNDGKKSLIIQFINGQTLNNINNEIGFSEKITIVFEIMMTINYLHKNNFVYRDLKPNNVMIDENKDAFIIDFDRMLQLSDISSNHEFTLDLQQLFAGPEVSKGEISFENDIYSIGKMIEYIFEEDFKKQNENSKLKQMFEMCTEVDIKKRPSISDLMFMFYENFSSYLTSKIIQMDQDVQSIQNKVNFNNQLFVQRKLNSEYFSSNDLNQISIDNPIFSFQNLPKKFKFNINDLNNDVIKKIYSQFNFNYFNFSTFSDDEINKNLKTIENTLFNFLRIKKFITYQIYDGNKNGSIQNNQSVKKLNVVFCTEKQCFIFESINSQFLISQLSKTKSILLDSDEKNSIQKEEIKEFCSKLDYLITNNMFISYTINPIVCYLIQRYYQPSSNFNDKSFFIFNNNDDDNDTNFKSILFNLFQLDDFQINEQNVKIIKEQIKEKMNEQESIESITITEFNENEFIKLRSLYSSDQREIYLAIHIPTLYIFAIKNVDNMNYEKEISFYQHYHHYSFTPFYGFIKKNGKIIELIYKFMSNGSLDKYLMNSKNQINDIFSITSLMRIFQGIRYFQSNSLIHCDIKPSNFLIDNNNNIYFSDFKTIMSLSEKEQSKNCINNFYYSSPEQIKGEIIDFQTDIYSIGLIIYLLYEKKEFYTELKYDMITNAKEMESLPKITNCSENIRQLYIKCIICCTNERAKLNDFQVFILKETKFKFVFNKYYLNEKNNHIKIFELINYLSENLYFLNQLNKSKNIDKCLNKIVLFISIVLIILKKKKISLFDNNNELPIFSINDVVNIGNLFYNGETVNKDYQISKQIYKLVQSDSNALLQLGKIYNNGYGVTVDWTKGINYFESSDCKGNLNASLELGRFNYENGKFEKAKEYFVKSSTKYKSMSFLMLGKLYFNGYGVTKSYEIAKNFFDLSAKQNNSEALLILGNFYFNGYGVERNIKMAKIYYEKSSFFYNSDALYNLGILYFNGIGVEKNYNKAIEYFELSAQFNNPNAVLKLGFIHWLGRKVFKNAEKSIEYFKRFIKMDEKENRYNGSYYIALHEVGMIYLLQKDVFNYEIAKQYIKSVADNGYPVAQNNLGLMYLLIESNPVKAIDMFERSSESNYVLADFNLGIYYEQIGNRDESIKYLSKAILNDEKQLIFRNKVICENEGSKFYILFVAAIKLSVEYAKKNNLEFAKKYFIQFLVYSNEFLNSFDFVFKKDIEKEFCPNIIILYLFSKYLFDELLNMDTFNINDFYYIYDKAKSISKFLILIKNMDQSQLNKIKNDLDIIYTKSSHYGKNPLLFYRNHDFFPNIVNLENDHFYIIKKNNKKEIINLIENNPKGIIPNFLILLNDHEFKKLFIKLMEESIESLMNVLYTYPYDILFGRLNVSLNPHLKGEDINESFYIGFES